MAIAQKLELRQGQALVMTPQLQQAIKLLQLSNLDLTAYVEEELQKNPLLEREEADSAPADRGEPDSQNDTPDAHSGEAELSISEDAPAADAEGVLDTDYESLYSDASKAEIEAETAPTPTLNDWSSAGSGKGGGEDMAFDATLSKELTLQDHLTEQLQIATQDPKIKMIGADLVDLIDEAGYVKGDLVEVADRLGADLSDVEGALALIQTFDPTGVGARDLKECLRIQLQERQRLDPVMDCFVENLELLAKHDMQGLMRVCGTDAEDVADMITEIRALNPKPGLAYGGAPAQPVTPDVFVRPGHDGGWKVELNNDSLPRVLVNSQYYAEVSCAAKGGDAKAYLSECLANANWLVKSLDQRAKTILKVSMEIVKRQDGFLVHGVQHLKPLNLKMIAEAISMHESTVSRVTSNKYISTPRGVFELKYFFTTAIASSDGGEAHSAEAVRDKIRQLIDDELPSAVLSDDRIVELLRQDGVDIARRTVAKVPGSDEHPVFGPAPAHEATIRLNAHTSFPWVIPHIMNAHRARVIGLARNLKGGVLVHGCQSLRQRHRSWRSSAGSRHGPAG